MGVPLSKPVAVLKFAHDGRFVTENDSVAPLGPLAEGWNAYAPPATSVVAGVPEIVGDGATLDWPASTCTENGDRVAVLQPSLTAIAILEYVPTLLLEGAPDSWPLLVLKLAQAGMLAIAKTRVRPSESLAVGVNE